MCQRYPNLTSAPLPESQHTCCTSLPSTWGFLQQGVVVVSCDIINFAFAFTSSMGRCYLSLLHDGIWCIALTIRQWWMLPSGLAIPVCFGQCSLEIVWSQPAPPPVVKSQHLLEQQSVVVGYDCCDRFSDLFWASFIFLKPASLISCSNEIWGGGGKKRFYNEDFEVLNILTPETFCTCSVFDLRENFWC